MFATARAIHGQAFATERVPQKKDVCDLLPRGGRRKINRFRYAAVAVSLENCLHPYVVRWGNVVGGDKQPPNVLRNLCQMLDRFRMADLTEQGGQRESPSANLPEKFGMDAL